MTFTYTALKLTAERQVPLFEGHVRRLGEASRGSLLEFAAREQAGV